jgi:hypothetical protein
MAPAQALYGTSARVLALLQALGVVGAGRAHHHGGAVAGRASNAHVHAARHELVRHALRHLGAHRCGGCGADAEAHH